MLQLIYASRRKPEFKSLKILDMVEKSRIENAKNGLSGMLLYKDDEFLQVLEGFKQPLITLKDKIFADERHSEVKVISERNIETLTFTKWDMGYLNLDEDLNLPNQSFADMTTLQAWKCLLGLRDKLES